MESYLLIPGWFTIQTIWKSCMCLDFNPLVSVRSLDLMQPVDWSWDPQRIAEIEHDFVNCLHIVLCRKSLIVSHTLTWIWIIVSRIKSFCFERTESRVLTRWSQSLGYCCCHVAQSSSSHRESHWSKIPRYRFIWKWNFCHYLLTLMSMKTWCSLYSFIKVSPAVKLVLWTLSTWLPYEYK